MIATDKQVNNIKPGKDYVFLLDDLELAITREQLEQVTTDWNNGQDIEEIAHNERRKSIEVLLALIHQAHKGHMLRPFADRI